MGLMNMPTEAKNRVTIMVRSDPISALTWVAKGDSPRSIPATNAPSAGEMPTAWAAQVAPSPVETAKSTVSSRLAKRNAEESILGINW